MYYNAHHDTYKNTIHLWAYEDGKRTYEQIPWVPYVYTPVDIETNVMTIDGKYVAKKSFNDNKSYSQFQKDNTCYENRVLSSIQFLAERYHTVVDIQPPPLHICYLDIETPHDEGFPTVEATPAPIVLIANIDENMNRTVFGIGGYNGNQRCKYISCKSERDLLIKFFNWMERQSFDVITGWNITSDNKMNPTGGFDIPYIIRRTMKVFGDDTRLYKKLSPIGMVKIWEHRNFAGVYNIQIAGVYLIDYMALYKWFTQKNLESFKLDYVAEEELGRTKLHWQDDWSTMYDFYKGDWNRFVDYCILDADIVHDLESQLGYIGLCQTLSLYCCTTMNNYNSSTALIEGLMMKYFRTNGLCAPTLYGGSQEWFPAAYVKEPIKGIHKDEVDLDITSSYPTHMIIQNMSLETYFGRIVGFEEEDITAYKQDKGIHEPIHRGRPIYRMVVDYNRELEYPDFILLNDSGYNKYHGEKLNKFNKALKKGLLSISPCGSVFFNRPKGLMAEVVKTTYFERKKQKGLKGDYKRKAEACSNDKEKQIWMERSNNKHALQWAIKIIINSFFGVTGVPYSRYFNVNISEAITSGGRHTIQMGEEFVDDLLNHPNDGLMDIVEEIKVLCTAR